jgi:hypothetical protein
MVTTEDLVIEDGTIWRLDKPYLVRVGTVQHYLQRGSSVAVVYVGGQQNQVPIEGDDDYYGTMLELAAEMVDAADEDHQPSYFGSPIH